MAWIVVLGACGWVNAALAQQAPAATAEAYGAKASAAIVETHMTTTSADAQKPSVKAAHAMNAAQRISLRPVTAQVSGKQDLYQPRQRNLVDSYRNALSPPLEQGTDGR